MEQLANNASTTLSSQALAGDSTISVASAAAFPSTGNFRVEIDSEILLVTAVSGTTFTVTRGAESTTAATHSNGAAVTQVCTAGGLAQFVADRSGLPLLEEHTASNSAELDFTAWYSSAYDEYLIEFVNLLPVTNAVQLELQFSQNGGSSYDASASYSSQLFYWSGTGSAAEGQASGATFAWLTGSGRKASNVVANGAYNGSLRLFNPGSAVSNKLLCGQANFYNTQDSAYTGCILNLQYQQAAAVNAFRVLASSGNLSSGNVRVYGVPK